MAGSISIVKSISAQKPGIFYMLKAKCYNHNPPFALAQGWHPYQRRVSLRRIDKLRLRRNRRRRIRNRLLLLSSVIATLAVIACIACADNPKQNKTSPLDPSFKTIVSVKIAEQPSAQELLNQPTATKLAMSKYHERQVIVAARHGRRGTGLSLTDTLTAEQIDSFLAKRNSPMAGLGTSIVTAAKRYDINPALVLAIAGAETNFGKKATCYNAWGWGHKRFSSWEEAINTYTKELAQKYMKGRRCQTIKDVNRTYCGRSSWRKAVQHFYSDLMNLPEPETS